MLREEMESEIRRFCDLYSGRAIGEETRNRLENAGDRIETIENIYEELKDSGYL